MIETLAILQNIRLEIETNINDTDIQKKMLLLLDNLDSHEEEIVEKQLNVSYAKYVLSNSRVEFIFLQVLSWFLISRKRFKFVTDLAKTALNDPKIKFKQFWIVLLEESDTIQPIYTFFKNNLNYGDRFDTERFLFILADSEFDIGDDILIFLKSEYEVVINAALFYIESKNAKKYVTELKDFFLKTKDSDFIVTSGALLLKLGESPKVLLDKITLLELSNSEYFAETIEELRALL